MGNAEPRRDLGAVPFVAVEQLDHAGGLARRAHTLVEARPVDGVDEPHPPVRDERVRAAAELVVLGNPAEARVELVYPANRRATSSQFTTFHHAAR